MLAPRAVIAPIRRVSLVCGFAALRREHGGIELRLGDARALLGLRTDAGGPWDDAALRRFAMTFPARVRVVRKDGAATSTKVAERRHP